MIEAEGSVKPEDLRPNVAVLCAGSCAVAMISAFSLPWPAAIASITLGALMIAGADVDARTYLLPDIVTCDCTTAGILAAMALDPAPPWLGAGRRLRELREQPACSRCFAGAMPSCGTTKVLVSAM